MAGPNDEYNSSMVRALHGPEQGPPQGAPPADPDNDGDVHGDDQQQDPTKAMPVGLAQNAQGVPFQCGTCGWFQDGTCQNENPALSGREVQPEWCCNLYDHEGMEVVERG